MITSFVDYMKVKRLAQNTIDSYTKYVNEMLEYIGKPENEIVYADLLSWQSSLSKYSNSSINLRIVAAKKYFNYLYFIKAISENPVAELESLPINHKEKMYMDKDMIKAMLNTTTNIRNKAIILTIVTTGVRVSELVGLTRYQYEHMTGEDNREIVLKETKRNKERTIYINDETKNAIDNYLATRADDCDRLFVSFQNGPIHRNNLCLTLKNIAKKAGISNWEDICAHGLRAACATIMNENGVDIPTISKVLGHSSINTTMVYIKTNQAKANNAMRAMVF